MGLILDIVTTFEYNKREINALEVVTMKKDKRINVRANDKMVDRLKGLKAYMNSYTELSMSDSDVVELLIDYVFELNNFKDLYFYVSDVDNWKKHKKRDLL